MLRGSFSQRRAAVRREARAVERLESRTLLSSTLVPLQGVRDLVFDPGRDLLYATAGSAIHRYNPATGQTLAPLDAGVLLKGLDITPDGSAVYSAGGTAGSATLVRIDLPSGTLASQRFGDFREGGYDAAIDSTGRGLLTSETGFSNQVPVREFNSGGGGVVVVARPTPADAIAGCC